jgi:hypothetical protein
MPRKEWWLCETPDSFFVYEDYATAMQERNSQATRYGDAHVRVIPVLEATPRVLLADELYDKAADALAAYDANDAIATAHIMIDLRALLAKANATVSGEGEK